MSHVSAIILSGGRATRMGGADKGLMLLQQKPLIEHVIKRLEPQVDDIIINANREISRYQAFGLKVMRDEIDGFVGPLAGICLGLKHCQHDMVLTVPCDSPLLPLDLVERLLEGMHKSNADIAVASSDGNVHPVFCLSKKTTLPSLLLSLNSGKHKVSAWQKSLKYVEVDFSDCSQAFTNINTKQDLTELEAVLNHV